MAQPADWSGVAEAYDRSFGRLCAGVVPAVLNRLGSGSGHRLLDVGAGTGVLASHAADSGFHVVAVDPEPDMIELARRLRGRPGVEFRLGRLPRLDLPDAAFDAVVANFVVNHTPDPLSSVREFLRVGREGARIAVTIWRHG